MKRLLPATLLVFASCGTPTPSNNNVETDAGGNNTSAATNNNTTTSTNNVASGACGEIGARFIEAVRALPRACTTSADCKIVERGQTCDCHLAVSASSDTTAHDAIRAELDAEACANPFGCTEDQCPYRRLSEPGELYAHCGEGNECEIVQIVACQEFEAKKHGGLVASGGCSDATQCMIRADLNPCGCGEGISQNYPFLAAQAAVEMMSINSERCGLDCEACPPPGTPTCIDDGMENMVCSHN